MQYVVVVVLLAVKRINLLFYRNTKQRTQRVFLLLVQQYTTNTYNIIHTAVHILYLVPRVHFCCCLLSTCWSCVCGLQLVIIRDPRNVCTRSLPATVQYSHDVYSPYIRILYDGMCCGCRRVCIICIKPSFIHTRRHIPLGRRKGSAALIDNNKDININGNKNRSTTHGWLISASRQTTWWVYDTSKSYKMPGSYLCSLSVGATTQRQQQ